MELDLLSIDELDWYESEARDVEEEIECQAVWEPHSPLDFAEEQAYFADLLVVQQSHLKSLKLKSIVKWR